MRRDFYKRIRNLTMWFWKPSRLSLKCLVRRKSERLLVVRLRLYLRSKLIKFAKMLLMRLFAIFLHKRVFRLLLYINRLFLNANRMKNRSVWLLQVNNLMMITMMMIMMTICAKKIKRLCIYIINILRKVRLDKCVVKEMLLLSLRKKAKKISLNSLRTKWFLNWIKVR
jgi:hypothetical protein